MNRVLETTLLVPKSNCNVKLLIKLLNAHAPTLLQLSYVRITCYVSYHICLVRQIRVTLHVPIVPVNGRFVVEFAVLLIFLVKNVSKRLYLFHR